MNEENTLFINGGFIADKEFMSLSFILITK